MTDATPARLSTGIAGLDEVLHGGLIPTRSYMLAGEPGTGKTILGLHFLTEPDPADRSCLFINMEESERAIRANASTLGLDLAGLEFLDLTPEAELFTGQEQYDIFTPDEVDGPNIRAQIADRVRNVDPDRVVVDPLTRLRSLSPDPHQFRQQVTGFTQFLTEQDATVVFTSQHTPQAPDTDLQYLSDGTIALSRHDGNRYLTVPKFRGSSVEEGEHTVRITGSGMAVYPVLTPGDHQREFDIEPIASGVPEIDQMLHGGLERGSVSILSGPTGVGKTTLGTQFMKEAAGRGERSVIFMFEEDTRSLRNRCAAINIPVPEMTDRGTLSITEVEPLAKTPAEFAAMVREEVESQDASIVMIDGIDGYRLSLQGNQGDLERELNNLGRYLKNMGVAVILVDSVDGVASEFTPTNSGLSYLADNIVFLRYLEIQGELRKAIGILKKRSSDFERVLREFRITRHGIKVGTPLSNIRGILSGTPEFIDRAADARAPGRSDAGADEQS